MKISRLLTKSIENIIDKYIRHYQLRPTTVYVNNYRFLLVNMDKCHNSPKFKFA